MASMDKAREMKDSTFRGSDLKLFVRDVSNRQGRKRAITVRSWSTIQDVKQAIQRVIHVPPSAQSLYFGPLLSSTVALPNHRTLHDAGIYRSGETLLLDYKAESSTSMCSLISNSVGDVCISSSMLDSTPQALRRLIQQARRGLVLGFKPELGLDGSGGTYFLHDARKVRIAVFKPADEEPYAENNPRGYLQQAGQSQPLSLRDGIVPGEACIREVAAYLLDHEGFSGVPMTTLAEARHPTAFNNNGSHLKVLEGGATVGSHSIASSSLGSDAKKVGSFQEFWPSECTMDDISPSMISVEEVHKIAILDIRIMNADRNAANLLCRRNEEGSLELVPIDHGFCLRTVGDVSWMDWCWLDWPQLKKPLSPRSKNYILKLDIEADARLLHERLNISPGAIDYFRASSRLLKAGVQAGLSLYEIACMCCRNDDLGEIPSKLEMLFSMASELAQSAVDNGRWHHSAASSALAEQLSPRGGSLISEGFNRLYKSASSGMFHTVVLPDDMKQDYPGMVQSSASDSSSEAGDVGEKEDCDEWAAAVIADVSLDKSIPLKKNRTPSVESEESSESSNLSSSPKGFWHTRPGSPCSFSDDDGSISWSPNSSPKFLSVDPSLSPISVDKAKEKMMDRRPTVHFAVPDVEDFPLMDDVFGYEEEVVKDVGLVPSLSKESGLTRSLSYSALSAVKSTIVPSIAEACPKPFAKEFDQYRDYFLKFIDLVIVRETTAASHQAQKDMLCLKNM